ncbi:MAG: hypothetical protein ACLPQS_00525, partial [Acidimicrobiales bacterium]
MAASSKTRIRTRAGNAAALVLVSAACALAGASPAGAAVHRSPHVRSCPPTEEFLTSSTSQVFYGTGTTAWVYNYNTDGLSKTLTTSTSNTIGYELQSSQSVDAGEIFASADVSF